MDTKYRISKQDGEWIVTNRAGLILAYFQHKLDAQDYALAQRRADEQSQVLGDYNHEQLLRELAAESAAEFA
jgi:hypothetical protein